MNSKDADAFEAAWVLHVAQANGGMLCSTRLSRIWRLVRGVEGRGVPGALVEVGCNRGMTAALMRASQLHAEPRILRPLHVFDSFQGLSRPADEDKGVRLGPGDLSIPPDELYRTFRILGLPAPTVHAGWLVDTIDQIPSEVCIAHIDLDLYEPTYLALTAIYPRLSVGGIVIVDDFAPPARVDLDQGFPGVWRACMRFEHELSLPTKFSLQIGQEGPLGQFGSHAVLVKNESGRG